MAGDRAAGDRHGVGSARRTLDAVRAGPGVRCRRAAITRTAGQDAAPPRPWTVSTSGGVRGPSAAREDAARHARPRTRPPMVMRVDGGRRQRAPRPPARGPPVLVQRGRRPAHRLGRDPCCQRGAAIAAEPTPRPPPDLGHRALADAQRPRDRSVRPPPRDQPGDLRLTRRQRAPLGAGPTAPLGLVPHVPLLLIHRPVRRADAVRRAHDPDNSSVLPTLYARLIRSILPVGTGGAGGV